MSVLTRFCTESGLRFASVAEFGEGMRLLFLGDMVGKTGRVAVWDRLPGPHFRSEARLRHRQWRERRRRLRHYRGHLSGNNHCRRRCGDDGQSCLGSKGSGGILRAPRPVSASRQLSCRHARSRFQHLLCSQRRACWRGKHNGPRLHASKRRWTIRSSRRKPSSMPAL